MDSDDSDVAIASAIYILISSEKKKKRRKRRWWTISLFNRHNGNKRLNDLSIENSGKFQNFCRMSAEDFEFLLNLIGPHITKQTTHLRRPVSAKERLAVTLRFLASGDNYKSLSYLFRISPQLISRIVYEVCQALKKSLHTQIQLHYL